MINVLDGLFPLGADAGKILVRRKVVQYRLARFTGHLLRQGYIIDPLDLLAVRSDTREYHKNQDEDGSACHAIDYMPKTISFNRKR
jgi:hypothetical protein